jgi:transposase
LPSDNEFIRILSWPRGNRKIKCAGCGRKSTEIYDVSEWAVRDLPWSESRTIVFIEVYRITCPDCGVKQEKVPLLRSPMPDLPMWRTSGLISRLAKPWCLRAV